MKSRATYQVLASLVDARRNCEKTGNSEWYEKHSDRIEGIMKDFAPRGGGFDSGTTIDLARSTGERLVFATSFHHMNDGGYYDGWTDHTITVKPSLLFGYTLSIGGRDRNYIKDYIYQAFGSFLDEPLTWDDAAKRYTAETQTVLVR